LEIAVMKTVEWTKTWISGGNVRACMNNQINEFLNTRKG
jgi:CDP-glucose 4,6-dehydratase